MSHIAAALAKSKGKTVQPATEDVPTTSFRGGVSRPPISMPSMADSSSGGAAKRKLIGGAVLAALLLGGGTWFLFLRTTPEAAPATSVTTKPVVAKPAQPANVVDFGKGPVTTAHAPTANVAAAEANTPIPSEEMFSIVRNFSVSAVVTGANARALIGGKTYRVGDQVSPGITLHEIKESLLIFVDDAGSVYPRRF